METTLAYKPNITANKSEGSITTSNGLLKKNQVDGHPTVRGLEKLFQPNEVHEMFMKATQPMTVKNFTKSRTTTQFRAHFENEQNHRFCALSEHF